MQSNMTNKNPPKVEKNTTQKQRKKQIHSWENQSLWPFHIKQGNSLEAQKTTLPTVDGEEGNCMQLKIIEFL